MSDVFYTPVMLRSTWPCLSVFHEFNDDSADVLQGSRY